MKKTSAIVVLLALLVLGCMIVSPVSAWTQLWTKDITLDNQGSQAFNANFDMRFADKGCEITRYTYITDTFKASSAANRSGSYTGNFYWDSGNGAGICTGTYDATWDFSGDVNTWDSAEIDISMSSCSCTNTPVHNRQTGQFVGLYDVMAGGGSLNCKMDYYSQMENYPEVYTDDHAMTFRGGRYGEHTTYSGSSVLAPVASFTCSPTSQYPDNGVVCTDSSTNSPTAWNWTLDAESWGYDNWQTHTGQNFTWQSHYPGIFSVNLQASNSAGSDWENKSSYVSISANATPNTCDGEPAAGYSRTKFRCMNPSNDASVFGCNIQLHDLEGGAWSNQTNLADAIWCIDTLPGHHINAYADATGYTSGSRLNLDEWDNMQYTLPLIPGYVPPAAAGKVWVYVYVTDWATQVPLSGAQVSISGSGLSTQTATTGSSGGVSLQWPNLTAAYINVAKTGYTTGSKTITTSSFGPDITYIAIHQGIYTATLTPVGTPVTTINPYGTPGPSGTMPAGYTNNQGQMMMDFLARNGLTLVELCFFVTILALLGVKLGK